jgi:hypothetical protein
MKSEIIELLGETDLLQPALIAEDLAANDRVKARLSVLQVVAEQARDRGSSHFNLTTECRRCRTSARTLEHAFQYTFSTGNCSAALMS